MASKSQVSNIFATAKEERIEKFKSMRSNMRVTTDNKCCYAMLYSVFEQYLLYLANTTTLPLSEQNTLLENEIMRFKAANKNFMSEVMWNKLLSSLIQKNQVPMYSAKNRVQRSFLVKLPSLLDEDSGSEAAAKEVEQDVKESEVEEVAATERFATPVIFNDNKFSDTTLTYLDGYYALIVDKIKKTAADTWFSTL